MTLSEPINDRQWIELEAALVGIVQDLRRRSRRLLPSLADGGWARHCPPARIPSEPVDGGTSRWHHWLTHHLKVAVHYQAMVTGRGSSVRTAVELRGEILAWEAMVRRELSYHDRLERSWRGVRNLVAVLIGSVGLALVEAVLSYGSVRAVLGPVFKAVGLKGVALALAVVMLGVVANRVVRLVVGRLCREDGSWRQLFEFLLLSPFTVLLVVGSGLLWRLDASTVVVDLTEEVMVRLRPLWILLFLGYLTPIVFSGLVATGWNTETLRAAVTGGLKEAVGWLLRAGWRKNPSPPPEVG